MMRNYPIKFDTLHGFECQTDLTNVAALREPIDQCINGSAAEKMGYTTDELMQTLHIYHNYIGLDNNTATTPPTRGLSQFLQDIGIQEDDFVVLKMDVEGAEFDLLERIMADGTHKLVDEVWKCKREGREEYEKCKGPMYVVQYIYHPLIVDLPLRHRYSLKSTIITRKCNTLDGTISIIRVTMRKRC